MVVSVIPARYGSSRFPGKPLALIKGKPMIQWVYERAQQAKRVNRTLIATDDQRIYDAVQEFGGEVLMTSADCKNGTERVAEVARREMGDVWVNVQGDEPLIDPDEIDRAVGLVIESDFDMGTLMAPLSLVDQNTPDIVKVTADQNGLALQFTRAPLEGACRHIGLYVYRREVLLKLSELPMSENEKKESLEQLRAMDHGFRIGIAEVPSHSMGVDTPEHLKKVLELIE